ncbi:hypothetical protein B0H19DRAFT_1276190 [Mycena capillaripes]|nr:hypothetical protein B0H19DRAFT_1276190 [Mycena capillaripes]
MPPKPPVEILALDKIRGGPINNSRKIAELVGIASAMTIDTSGQKKDLIARITDKFTTDTELAQKPEFLKFHAHRPENLDKGGKNSRNSADKAVEDGIEDKKNDLPPTGANLKLLEGGAKTDPPGQFNRLLGPKIDMNKVKTGSDGIPSDMSSISGSEKEDDLPATPPPSRKNTKTIAAMPIHVKFKGKLKSEIVIESSEHVALKIEGEGEGGPTYSASLKEILTEAISGDSPMKSHPKTKIYRQSVTDPEPDVYTLKLGSIEDIMSSNGKTALRFEGVDKYHLKPILGGKALLCDLFTAETGDEANSQAPGPSATHAIHSAPTGASKPLEVAQQRAAAAAETKPAFDQAFKSFIAEVVGPRDEWALCKTARQVRDRYQALEDAVRKMNEIGWNKSGGGYRVPFTYTDSVRGDYDFKGQDFSKETLGESIHIKHAAAGTDRKMMNKDLLQHWPKALAWFADPDNEELGAKKFNNMEASEFKARAYEKKKQAAKKKAQRKRDKETARAAEAAKKKRKQPISDGSDPAVSESSASESDEPSQKRKSKKKKVVYFSSDLDGDSS